MSGAGAGFGLRDTLWALGVTLVFGVLLRVFVLDACRVPTVSMENTLTPGDHLLVNRLAAPSRGDVLAFTIPLPGGESRVFVKRCLAGPGDIVPPGLGQAAGTVMPPDRYFMVGDNRAESRDSRSFGPVPRSAIVGRAVLVYWSVDPARGGAQGIRWSRIGTVVE